LALKNWDESPENMEEKMKKRIFVLALVAALMVPMTAHGD